MDDWHRMPMIHDENESSSGSEMSPDVGISNLVNGRIMRWTGISSSSVISSAHLHSSRVELRLPSEHMFDQMHLHSSRVERQLPSEHMYDHRLEVVKVYNHRRTGEGRALAPPGSQCEAPEQ